MNEIYGKSLKNKIEKEYQLMETEEVGFRTRLRNTLIVCGLEKNILAGARMY